MKKLVGAVLQVRGQKKAIESTDAVSSICSFVPFARTVGCFVSGPWVFKERWLTCRKPYIVT